MLRLGARPPAVSISAISDEGSGISVSGDDEVGGEDFFIPVTKEYQSDDGSETDDRAAMVISPAQESTEKEHGSEKDADECDNPLDACPLDADWKHGAQGSVRIGCPGPEWVRKTLKFKTFCRLLRSECERKQPATDESQGKESAKRMTLQERFEELCGRTTETLNVVSKVNSTILPGACRFCKRQNMLVLEQRVAEGPSLYDYLKDLIAAYPKMSAADRTEEAYILYCIAVQVLSGIDSLYRAGLYHNDLNPNNIILRPLTKGITLPIGGRAVPFSPAARCPFHVALIDYTLVTPDSPLDPDFRRVENGVGMAPLYDVCHFFNSLATTKSAEGPVPPDVLSLIYRVFEPVCLVSELLGEGTQFTSRSNVVLRARTLTSTEIQQISVAESKLVYASLLDRVLAAHGNVSESKRGGRGGIHQRSLPRRSHPMQRFSCAGPRRNLLGPTFGGPHRLPVTGLNWRLRFSPPQGDRSAQARRGGALWLLPRRRFWPSAAGSGSYGR